MGLSRPALLHGSSVKPKPEEAKTSKLKKMVRQNSTSQKANQIAIRHGAPQKAHVKNKNKQVGSSLDFNQAPLNLVSPTESQFNANQSCAQEGYPSMQAANSYSTKGPKLILQTSKGSAHQLNIASKPSQVGIPAQVAVVKKLRKPSHQKHNSIDRTHYLPKAQAKNTIKKIAQEVELRPSDNDGSKIPGKKLLKSFDHSSKNAQGSFEHNFGNLNENYKGSNEASGISGESKRHPKSNQSQIQEGAGSSYGQENVKPIGASGLQQKAKQAGSMSITVNKGQGATINKSGSNSKSNQVSSGSNNVIKKQIKTFQNGPTKMEIIFATQDLQKKPSKIQSQKQTFCTQNSNGNAKNVYKSFDCCHPPNQVSQQKNKQQIKKSILENQKQHLKQQIQLQNKIH